MTYLATLFIILAMVWVTSIVGRRVCDFASFRLAPAYRFYFSPLFGLALFVLVFTMHGWVAPFRPVSSIAIVAGLVVAALWFEKDRRTLLRYLGAMSLFAFLASSPVLFPLLRFDAYNPFNDTFTYLVHSQWLQSHAFSEPAVASAQHPALTQVALYQVAGLRMGASFLLGWAQSVFGLEWSYYAFPAVVSLPLIAGSLAAGGAVKLIVRGHRLVSILAAAMLATMFNGFSYGAMSGFFPQTFGLAFAVGGATLLAALVAEGQVRSDLRTTARSCLPAALVFAALVVTYNDMLSFIAVGCALSLVLLLRHAEYKRGILVVFLMLFAQTALLVNLELVRVIRNFVGMLLSVGKGVHAVGWPVLWSPAEFLAHALGLKSPLEGLWMLGSKEVTLAAAALLAASVLYFVFAGALRARRRSAYAVMHFSIVIAMAAGFVYFRYFGKGPSPAEAGIGYTFLQFKLAKWAGPFCLVLMGATFAYLQGRARGLYALVIPSVLVVIIALGTAGNYRFAAAETAGFLRETGYQRSAFSALLHLRELAKRLPGDDVIYLNLGAEHEKLRQMIAHVLHDRKLAADWSADNYIGGNLGPDQRNTPARAAAWMIAFAGPNPPSDPVAGNLLLKTMPAELAIQVAVTGGHARETDGTSWWNWTEHSLSYSLHNPGKGRLRFTYLSAAGGRKELKIFVKGTDVTEFSLAMKDGWNEYISPPLEVGELSIRIVSEQAPVRLSATDPRMASFAIRNLEVVQDDGGTGRK